VEEYRYVKWEDAKQGKTNTVDPWLLTCKLLPQTPTQTQEKYEVSAGTVSPYKHTLQIAVGACLAVPMAITLLLATRRVWQWSCTPKSGQLSPDAEVEHQILE